MIDILKFLELLFKFVVYLIFLPFELLAAGLALALSIFAVGFFGAFLFAGFAVISFLIAIF